MNNNKNRVLQIYAYLSKKRKNQLWLLLISLLISSFLEAFTLASAIPFITFLASPNIISENRFFNFIKNFFQLNDLTQLFLPITITFCIFIIASTFLRLFNAWFIFFFSEALEVDLNNIILKKNLFQNYNEFSQKNSSTIISMVVDKSASSAAAIASLIKVAANSMVGLAIITTLIIYNWKIALISFSFISIYYLLISSKVKKVLLENSKDVAILEIKRIKVLQEAFGSFRDIVINNTQNIFLDAFNDYQKKCKRKVTRSSFITIFPKYLIEAFTLLMIVIIGYKLSRVSDDLSYITILGTYSYGGLKLLPILQQIYSGWSNYKFKSENFKYILNELKVKEERKYYLPKDYKSKISFKKIEFKNVSFSYENGKNSINILNNINLKIFKGDFVGIYGKTGSGKSTLIDILMGLQSPNKGEILLNNENLYDKNNLFSWRQGISHVPQNIFLKDGTIEDNILFDTRNTQINNYSIREAMEISKIYDFIINSRTGLKTVVGERGIRLSGGQKQRIAIARAIIRMKNFLVLDEATSAIDEATEQSIIESIKDLNKNMTIIMITHREKSLKNCNRIFKVDKGSVIDES